MRQAREDTNKTKRNVTPKTMDIRAQCDVMAKAEEK